MLLYIKGDLIGTDCDDVVREMLSLTAVCTMMFLIRKCSLVKTISVWAKISLRSTLIVLLLNWSGWKSVGTFHRPGVNRQC